LRHRGPKSIFVRYCPKAEITQQPDQLASGHRPVRVNYSPVSTLATPVNSHLARELKRTAASPFVFTSERAAPFTTAGFAKMVARAGEAAKLKGVHPHMLRHACGYALANKGHDTRALQAYLGHKNIQHTVRYTELSPTRFKDFWRD
jgi:site-specific recombinase XerD